MLRSSSFQVMMLVLLILCGQSMNCRAEEKGEVGAAAVEEGKAVTGGAKEEFKTMGPIEWFLRSSGLIGLFILGLSIYFVSLIIRLFTEMRQVIAVPPDLVAQMLDLIKARDFQGAFDLARTDDSPLGRMLTAGIAELPNGLPDAREALERVGEAETVEMEKRISMLAVLGTLGPMIGLLGTLLGMMESFSAIAMSGQTMRADQVAGGISRALLLTFEGVGLSVPAIYFFAFFRNRVATISVNAMLEADQLLRFFYRTGRSKGGAASVSAPVQPIR
jgi:biopolymer transport protein ExbB